MYLKALAAFTFVALFSACSQSSTLDLKEGEWRIETSTEIAGMPMSMPPVTVTQCLTQEDAVPTQRSQEGNPCTITEQSVNGSTLTWKVECPNSTGSGTMTYNHDTFSGSMTMEANTPGGTMNMVSKMKGRYLGPCKK
jgi:hypothetical protein